MSLTIMAVGGIFLALGLMLAALLLDDHYHPHPKRRHKRALRHKTS